MIEMCLYTIPWRRDKLQTALKELAKDTEGHYFLAALRDIISTFVSYRATNTPPFVTHCLQGVSRSTTVPKNHSNPALHSVLSMCQCPKYQDIGNA